MARPKKFLRIVFEENLLNEKDLGPLNQIYKVLSKKDADVLFLIKFFFGGRQKNDFLFFCNIVRLEASKKLTKYKSATFLSRKLLIYSHRQKQIFSIFKRGNGSCQQIQKGGT